MTGLKSVLSALLLLSSVAGAVAAPAPCQRCHEQNLVGVHQRLACLDCHGAYGNLGKPTSMATAAAGCVHCHAESDHIFRQAMTTRQAEQRFCQRSWGQADHDFFAVNCTGCHVTNCLDCHGDDGHAIHSPGSEACYRCHNGYFVGWEFAGRAPREDSIRYQRGPEDNAQHYLKMRPDVHADAGMDCGDCHNMASLQAGKQVAQHCLGCHDPDPQVIEHSIPAHMQKLECVSCHAGWAAQEYGTFYIQTRDSSNRSYFRVRKTNDQYVKSSYLKRQDLPPLGLNEGGRVAPIRPQFIAYYSEMENNKPIGAENRLLAAEWKAFAPHTIRRGTPMCDSCHGNARRFMLEPLAQRIYRPDLDGLGLDSFWRTEGQTVVNGSFFSPARFNRMSKKSTEYSRKYVEKWQNFLKKDGASSEH
ncbi:MAG: cytochrome C [Desulfuromonas sp.]|nr:cytochrome C [Desulfuromonas sp.]